MSFRAFCSEFPNDNFELHDGTVWANLSPTGPLRAIRRAACEPSTPEEPAPVVGPVSDPGSELRPGPPAEEPAPELELAQCPPAEEPAPESARVSSKPDAFEHLLGVIAKIALESGATRAAAVVPRLLRGEAVEETSFSRGDASELVARGLLARDARGLSLGSETLGAVTAWSRVLRGECDDLGDCGGTLDGFMAELLSELSGTPSRRDEVRRELRRHGVAAFGLLVDAA